MSKRLLSPLGLLALALPTGAQAQSITLTASHLGVYESFGGYSQTPDMRYDIGAPAPTVTIHSYYVFDIPLSLGFTPTSATLSLRRGDGGQSDTGTESASFYAVTTPIADLLGTGAFRTGAGLAPIYDDLGDGTVYGSLTTIVPLPGADGDILSYAFNGVIPAVTGAAGGQLAFGGALTTLGATNEGYIFNGVTTPLAQLTLRGQGTSVPEPGGLALLAGVSVCTAGGLLRRRRRA